MENAQTFHPARHSEMTKRGMTNAVQRGRVVGVCPLGYRLSYDRPGGKSADFDEERAALVAMAFCLIAEGNSIRETVRRVQALGLTGRQGQPISKPSLHLILRNPFYMGLLRYKGERYKGNHPALISRTLFATVQERLSAQRYR
jgi:site-specific DNA recombinase